MSEDSKTIKIAIIGGGLAGATLANALLAQPHLDINIFESAPEFSERGAAVGISTNGQSALAESADVLADVIDRAGGVVMTSSRLMIASGPDKMTTLFDLAPEQRGKVVHRAALLAELHKPIDPSRKHTSKKVSRIDDSAAPLTIHFEDGSSFTADAVIGADGVRGHVRSHVLGSDHPAVPAAKAQFWDCRSLVPMAKAKELIGAEYFDVPRQYGWIGDGGFAMHDILDNGETVQFVVSCLTETGTLGDDEWSSPLDQEGLEKALRKWDDTPLKEGVVKAMLENPELKAYAHNHHAVDAPTYAKGAVCIMGDAAHCMTPWQGSGAGTAIEDAMILSHLLSYTKDPSGLPFAFKAYDQVRRPRTQRIVHSSAEVGVMLCGRGPGLGLDVEKIREAMPGRWAFIMGLDMGEHKREAVEILEGLRKSG